MPAAGGQAAPIELFSGTSQLRGGSNSYCPSVKRQRPDIQGELVQQWHSVMHAKVIYRILGLLQNVFHTKN